MRRREEHKLLLQHLTETERYEKRYRLIEMALQKILEGLHESRANLLAAELSPDFTEFPQEVQLADALAFVLENTCLAGDLILRFPDVSYRILGGNKGWYPLINWSSNFTRHVDSIVDDLSMKMLNLLRQELNEDERTEDYFNPYLEANQPRPEPPKMHFKKARKRIRRGPSLSGKQEL